MMGPTNHDQSKSSKEDARTKEKCLTMTELGELRMRTELFVNLRKAAERIL
jgi:hypothetical protein